MVLILVTGLLTFHPPHFLLEPGRYAGGDGSSALEVGLGLLLLAALVAGVGIWRDRRWGWVIGLVIAAAAIGLYLAQQTLGLPGLPKDWTEPSRIVSLIVEALFIVLAIRQLRGRAPYRASLPTSRAF